MPMEDTPTPLTAEQEQALLRFLGSSTETTIVMAAAKAHYVRIEGEHAMKLAESHTLPGRRTVRYCRHGRTLFVADVAE
jgi:hypothetical protein